MYRGTELSNRFAEALTEECFRCKLYVSAGEFSLFVRAYCAGGEL